MKVFGKNFWEIVDIRKLFTNLLLLLVTECFGLHITNLTAPTIQDPREDMALFCSFYIGNEELYALKWYKDDSEFFRYSPKGKQQLLEFEVTGVYVDEPSTECNISSCYLILKNLTRAYSSGVYRCEVSIEAPTFRLASKIQNVTVAVVPTDKPVILNISSTYLVGDILTGTCSSALGDPTPTISWYINDKMVNPRYHRSNVIHQEESEIDLTRTSSLLHYPLSKKLLGNNSHALVKISCRQSTAYSEPQKTTKTIRLITESELAKHQKYFDIFGSTSTSTRGSIKIIITALVFVYK